jgi:tryptophan synthase beta subunit
MPLPDKHGHFGPFGGRYVPETLMPALFELEEAYRRIKRDKEFQKTLRFYLETYVGRPTPLYPAKRLSEGSITTSAQPTNAGMSSTSLMNLTRSPRGSSSR